MLTLAWLPPVSRLSRVRQESGPFTFTYRASGLRDGQHDFNRMDMWPVMGSAVCARFGAETARVSLKEFDIEVRGRLWQALAATRV